MFYKLNLHKVLMKYYGRFALNTTLGLGGFVDVAKSVGLEQNDEDFEQTLAVWGIPSSRVW